MMRLTLDIPRVGDIIQFQVEEDLFESVILTRMSFADSSIILVLPGEIHLEGRSGKSGANWYFHDTREVHRSGAETEPLVSNLKVIQRNSGR